MKKFTYLLFLAIGVTSCSVESMDSTENLLTADAGFKIASINTEMKFENQVCAGEETTITVNFPQRSNSQGNLLKTLIKVELKVAGEWIEIYNENLNEVTTTSFQYTFNDVKEYELRYSAENGPWNPSQFLDVQDCSTCENSLEALFTCGDVNTLTVTFTAEEAGPIVIQGGLNNWAVIKTAEGVGVTEVEKPGKDESNASVTRWEGNLEACQEVTITITFTGGDEVGSWTAKRNEVELGVTEDQTCLN